MYKFNLTNHTRRVSKTRTLPWDTKRVSNRLNFAMKLYDFIEYYAANRVFDEVVAATFTPAEYQAAYPTGSELRVGMQVEVQHGRSVTRESYVAGTDKNTGYQLTNFDVADFLEDGHYILVSIRTDGATAQTVAQIDRKAAPLHQALLAAYGPAATHEIRVDHQENSKTVREERYFAHRGTPLTAEEITAETGFSSANIESYMNLHNG